MTFRNRNEFDNYELIPMEVTIRKTHGKGTKHNVRCSSRSLYKGNEYTQKFSWRHELNMTQTKIGPQTMWKPAASPKRVGGKGSSLCMYGLLPKLKI